MKFRDVLVAIFLSGCVPFDFNDAPKDRKFATYLNEYNFSKAIKINYKEKDYYTFFDQKSKCWIMCPASSSFVLKFDLLED